MPLLVMGNQLDSVVDRTLNETIEHYYRHKESGLCIRTKATHFKSMYLIDSRTQRTPLKTTLALIIAQANNRSIHCGKHRKCID